MWKIFRGGVNSGGGANSLDDSNSGAAGKPVNLPSRIIDDSVRPKCKHSKCKREDEKMKSFKTGQKDTIFSHWL